MTRTIRLVGTSVTPLHMGHYTGAANSSLAGQRVLVTAFLVRHKKGLLLFDTGFTPFHTDVLDLYAPVWIRDVREALKHIGTDPSEITMIANCHLHSDHAGGNYRFPGVPIYAQKSEIDAARSAAHHAHLPSALDFSGAQIEEISGELELWPGVRLVPTPGHTVGHQSLVVETDDGGAILTGQAVNSAVEFDRLNYDLTLTERGHVETSAIPAWLVSLARFDAARIYFAHDRSVWLRDAIGRW